MTPAGAPADSAALDRGDLPPRIVTPPPGPRSRALARRLARAEAPGVNTLFRGRAAIAWREALGSNVLDVDGNRYLDLTAGFGVAAVGHRHPRVVAAVERQAARLLHGLGDVAAHPTRVELAERLAGMAPVDDPVVHWAISGADAVEVALKTCLLATGRPGVVAFDPGYHGLTLGALAATSRPAFREPFRDHLHPHLVRLPWGCDGAVLAAALADGGTACVLLEPMVGREGVLPPPGGWLPAVADAARAAGALLIADEIFTGFGRTGSAFAVEHDGVRPDLLCCGKALAGGLPIGAVVGRRAVMAAWETPGEALHTATFLGHPLSAAAALEVLDLLAAEGLPARAARLGEAVGARLAGWPERFPAVTAVRGRGLLWGIELADGAAAAELARRAAAAGVLLLAGGPEGRVAQVVPPLTITEDQLALALDLLAGALGR